MREGLSSSLPTPAVPHPVPLLVAWLPTASPSVAQHPSTLSAEAHIAMVGSASASFPTQSAGLVMASGWARKLTSVTPCGEGEVEGMRTKMCVYP